MISKKLKRSGGVVAATALLVSAAAVAHAEDIGPGDIRPDETNYQGWHQGDDDGSNSFEVRWDGLHLGYNGKAQIINGLGEHGDTYAPMDRSDLESLITSAEVEIVDGDVWFQVPVFFGGDALESSQGTNFTTLRPADSSSTGSAAYNSNDEWQTSQEISNEYGENATAPLSELLDAIYEEGGDAGAAPLAYGFFASASATVKSITWGGETTTFGLNYPAIDQTGSEVVPVDDIRPDESEYTGWHEGRTNDEPAYEAACEGLLFGVDGVSSQIINGFDEDTAIFIENFEHFAALMMAADVDVADGEVFFQLPLFVGEEFTTLRPADASGPGGVDYDLTDQWISSNDIGAADVTANDSMALGDLLEALVNSDQQIVVIGYGVLAWEAPATVSTVTFDGFETTFEGLDCVPMTPLEPSTPIEDDDAPNDDASNDDDAASPVVREPAYTG